MILKKIKPQTSAEAVIVEVRVYRDEWTPSRPWCADLVHADGQKIRKYNSGYRTKKDLIENIDHMMNVLGYEPKIVRGEDR